jgi:PTS system galactitol-specific IIA component
MVLFDNDCVAFNVKLEGSKHAIFLLSRMLEKKGAVSANYAEAVYKREQSYPTGLPTKPYNIALPHADFEKVYQPALAVATLTEPVIFKNMEDPNSDLPVLIIILLANKRPDEQFNMVRHLAKLFSQGQKLISLQKQKTIGELVAWMRTELKLDTIKN